MLGVQTQSKTSLIGIDFGACSLCTVQLNRSGDEWRIHHWVNIESEPESSEPPSPDYEKELSLAFGPGTFTGQRTSLLLSPPQVDYQLVDVPQAVLELPSSQMRNALQIELDRHLPWPSNECEIAAWPVGANNGKLCSVMVTATRTKDIQQRLDLLEAASLEAVRADILPHAMIELYHEQATSDIQETNSTIWGVLDIGFQGARLYLIHEDKVVYGRSVSGGGCDITQTLSEALKVEFAIAERYKRVYGIEPSDRGFRSVVGGLGQISEESLPGMLFAILRPTLDAMTKEIERAYRFVLSKVPGSSPGPLWLVGGGARLKGLTAVLGDGLGVPVALPDSDHVLGRQDTDTNHPAINDTNGPVLAGCVGLAMIGESG